MKFGYTIIYVGDVESTVVFYEKVFNLKQHFMHESKQYAELDTGDSKLAFASNELAKSNGVSFVKNDPAQAAPGFEVAFIAEDVNEAYQHALRHGAISVKEPMTKPWGQDVAYVRDLNGITVEICSSIA